MKFKQIVILDNVKIPTGIIPNIQKYSENSIKQFNTDPSSDLEVQNRIWDADCILLTWRTTISKETIAACKNLKFIWLCSTNSNCIDLEACTQNEITVSNIFDYADEWVAEYIMFQLLWIMRGQNWLKRKAENHEINKKTIWLIGLWAVGKLVAKAALGFNMRVLYNSNTRKPEREERGLVFCDKEIILQDSDFISLQTPKNLKILNKSDFDMMKWKVLINTTLWKPFLAEDFLSRIEQENNFSIMDSSIDPDFVESFKDIDKVLIADFVSWITQEAVERLANLTIKNMEAYLSWNPINKIN